MEETIIKNWQLLTFIFIAIVSLYMSVIGQKKNDESIKEHDKRISSTENNLTAAVNERNMKLNHIDSQLEALRASNDRNDANYKEMRNDIKNIYVLISVISENIAKITTTCNLRKC